MTLFRATLRRITSHTWTLALLGNAALLLLGWAWLYIPDSHTWQFLFAMLLGAAIVAGFFGLHATIIRRLHPSAAGALWQSAVILAGWLFLGHVLQHLTGLLSANVTTRAGYWNSQVSAHQRAIFTYERLVNLQNLTIETFLWIVIPALLLPFTVEITAHTTLRAPANWRSALATLRRWELWLIVALAYGAGSWLGDHLLDWHPAHSTFGELFSVVLRTAGVYCLAVALLLITIAAVAELLSRAQAHSGRNTTP